MEIKMLKHTNRLTIYLSENVISWGINMQPKNIIFYYKEFILFMEFS